MKIVVLDGYTLNPGDLAWSRLEALGSLTVHERTLEHQTLERAAGADILLTNNTPLGGQLLAALPKLRYICEMGTGYDLIDVFTAEQLNITVSNIPGYGTSSVAQMAFAHILNFCSRVSEHNQAVREGEWASSHDFCFWNRPLVELENLVLGIVGYGQIGRRTAELGRAFGMQVIAYDPDLSDHSAAEAGGETTLTKSLEALFAAADFISLHTPLLPTTRAMINRRTLAMMKPTAYLINTARGALIEEQDLAEALCEGRISGAGLDVLTREPPDPNNPLFSAPNCVITPHIAWASTAARQRLMDMLVDHVAAFIHGKPYDVAAGPTNP